MRWKDVEGGGLAIEVDSPRVPTLSLESFRGGRIRLMRRGAPVFWARTKGGEGVWIARAEGGTSPGVIPPITAREARATTRAEDWMRFVARGLDESEVSPLRAGSWQLTELRPGATPHQLEPVDADRLPAPAHDVQSSFDAPANRFLPWGLSGSGAIVPLRSGSPLEASRVKAWRKHAREGTLPPIVLWWITMLDAHLLLDGHDRLRAALAEGMLPRAIVLWEPRWMPHVGGSDEHAIATYERAFFAEHALSEVSRRRINATLVGQFAGWRVVSTTARARAHEDPALTHPLMKSG